MYLGIDTSAYTTSLALTDHEGRLLEDQREMLKVDPGEQGLQQSRALFGHLKNLPQVIGKTLARYSGRNIKAIAVSARPRPREDSYMPVFIAGLSLAESLSKALSVPLVTTSHQEGHLAAGLWSTGLKTNTAGFLALHLSGGTTELLLVTLLGEKPLKFDVKILGGSSDIHAGQLIDRIGVAMELPFPAGPALENLARHIANGEKILVPSAVKGFQMSFSGAETLARVLLHKNIPREVIARSIEHCIATSVEKVTRKAVMETGRRDVLVVGGVGANQYIRERLKKRLEHRAVGARLYFPEPAYSSDNAVGVSLIAQSLDKENEEG